MAWEEPSGSIEFPCTPLSQINLVFHSAREEDAGTCRICASVLWRTQISPEFRRHFAAVRNKGGKTILFSSWVKPRLALHLSHLPCRYGSFTGSRERPHRFWISCCENLIFIFKEDQKREKPLNFMVSLTSPAPPFVSHQPPALWLSHFAQFEISLTELRRQLCNEMMEYYNGN